MDLATTDKAPNTHGETMAGLKSLGKSLNKKAQLDAFTDSWFEAKQKEYPKKSFDQLFAKYWPDCMRAANAAGLRG